VSSIRLVGGHSAPQFVFFPNRTVHDSFAVGHDSRLDTVCRSTSQGAVRRSLACFGPGGVISGRQIHQLEDSSGTKRIRRDQANQVDPVMPTDAGSRAFGKFWITKGVCCLPETPDEIEETFNALDVDFARHPRVSFQHPIRTPRCLVSGCCWATLKLEKYVPQAR